MGIGDFSFSSGNSNQNNSNDNGNRSKVYEPNYYSRFKIKNNDQGLVLSAKFNQGLLYVDLSTVDKNTYKTEQVELICLSPTKAMLFATEIKNFLKYLEAGDIEEAKAFGVCGGMGEKVSYAGLHADADKNIYLTIGKFDNQGSIIQAHTLQFNKDYNYSLQWSNINSNILSKNYNNLIEITQLLNLVEDFARYMNGSAGYSALDLNRYEAHKDSNNMKLIFDKLGIERPYSNNYNRGGGNNDFLSNSSRVEPSHTTIESIEGLLDD